MNNLHDVIQEKQTALFEELGVFFAFSDSQFNEGVAKYGHLKPEGTKWAHLSAGMFLPKVNVDEFIRRHEEICKAGVKEDLDANGRAKILDREMSNYEIGLSWDGVNDPNFRDGIAKYGFTEEEIQAAYKKHMEENEY